MNLFIYNGLGYYLKEICVIEELFFFFYEDVNKIWKNFCILVLFEFKELKDVYFSKIEDDYLFFDDL